MIDKESTRSTGRDFEINLTLSERYYVLERKIYFPNCNSWEINKIDETLSIWIVGFLIMPVLLEVNKFFPSRGVCVYVRLCGRREIRVSLNTLFSRLFTLKDTRGRGSFTVCFP